jgi:hypothetical protein
MATQKRFKGFTIFTLALACAMLAIISPQWRSELLCFGYYQPPGISIGAPSANLASTGPVSYKITYTAVSSVTLAAKDVTLNKTGTATGTVTITGSGSATRKVVISKITGIGTLGISIAANTAKNKTGAFVPAAGPSATFNANNPTIAIVSPNGGEKTFTGQTILIVWQIVGDPGPQVKIELLKGTAATLLNPGIATTALSWPWTIPAKQATGTNYKIRITSKTIPTIKGISNADFSISKTAGLQSSAGPAQTVQGSEVVTLSGSNSIEAPKGGVSYKWTQLDGPPVTLSNPFARETTFIAPAAEASGKSMQFELTAAATDGGESKDTCIVNVSSENDPLVANAGPDQTVFSSEIVELDGSGSSGTDGIVSFEWKQIMGIPVELSGNGAAKPTFVAPELTASGSLVFELTVTDNAGLRSRAQCIVNVKAANDAPVTDAGTDRTVTPGTVVALDGSGSKQTDGRIASLQWTQIFGSPVILSDPTSIKPVFTAPQATSKLVFQLTVTDEAGLQSKANVAVLVQN